MINIAKALRVFSMILGLLILFYVYASMPERVGLGSDSGGDPSAFVPRSTFFYISLVLLVASNLIYLLIREVIQSGTTSTYEFKNRILIWANGTVVFLNLFLMSAFTFIFAFNSPERLPVDIFGSVVYITLGLLILWISGVIFVLSKNRKQAV